MIKLFKFESYNVTIEPEVLLLAPFKKLWDRDKSKDKSIAMQELAYIYFMGDPRSDYQYIIDEESRLEEVYKTNGLKKRKFTTDEVKCIELYKQLTTTTSLELLKSLRLAVSAVQDELAATKETLSQLESKDKVNALKSLTSTIATIPNLIKQLVETEKLVSKEIEETTRKRGGDKGSSVFEEGGF